MDDNRITYFAETDARNKRVRFGIKAKDRTRHVYVIGKTGMGKSTMLENMAVQDIMGGEGMAFIDPHGKTADLLLEYVPKERIRDVVYIAPFDVEYPISFNVLESVDPTKRHLVASGLMSTFKKIWEDAWSARMEYILTNTLLALLEAPGSTLLGVNRMLSDKEYRKEILNHVKDPSVKTFWTKEFANYTERMAQEAVPSIQNKVGQFTANPLIRNMIGQPESSFDFRKAMDSRKIIIINLSKGRIGDENMKLLGGLLVTKIYLAAMSRADIPDRAAKLLPNFYLFVDEFQNFANASFADILSEARKYKLNLTIAHQYIEQMDEQVRAAVFGNVGTMIAFRVGATDAEVLEKEFMPAFTIEDLVNLGFTQIYLKLMIDGLTSSPFSAVTLPPIPHPDTSFVKEIIAASREQFSRPRAEVEEEIIKFHNPPVPEKPKPQPSSFAPGFTGPRPAPVQSIPRNGPAKAVSQMRQPFAGLKNLVRPVPPPIKEAKNPVPFSVPANPPASPSGIAFPVPGAVESKPAKPVPLSSLEKRPAKADPKVPSTQNVNDLRSALQSILGKPTAKQESLVVQKVEPKPAPVSNPVPEAVKEPAKLEQVPKPSAPASSVSPLPAAEASSHSHAPASPNAEMPASPARVSTKTEPAPESKKTPDGKPKEVPEEVLKKVLKVD